MRVGPRVTIAWCVVFMACGGSTTRTGLSSENHGGSSGQGDSGETGGRPGSGGAKGSGGTAEAGGASGTGAFGRAGSYGARAGRGPDGGVICRDVFCNPPPDPEPPGPSLCGGVACASGETCCLSTLKCFDAKTDPGGCRKEPPSKPDPNGRPSCSSNADCGADGYCEPAGYAIGGSAFCGGAGYCQSRTNCGLSGGSVFCGCDGRTYPNVQTACFYGVRLANLGACGSTQILGGGGTSAGHAVTLCGADDQCPGGQHCCPITGLCYADAEKALCAYPPEGASRACLTNADCNGDTEYCAGEGCEGPGGCKPYGECGALLKPVCGCDNQSYVNAECAASKGVRVASDGECK